MNENKTTKPSSQANKHIYGIQSFILEKKLIYIIIGFVFLTIFITSVSTGRTGRSNTSFDERENKLAQMICNIEGVENAQVMINYETTEDSQSRDKNVSLGFEELYIDKQQQKDYKNSISGVIVVAKGADNYMVKINILDAVKTVLNVPANKIEVLNMK